VLRGERLASHGYLAPGDHELKVRARNGHGPRSEVAAQRFEVEDRFHETTAFRIGGVLLVVLAAFGSAERRVKRSRERTAELVQLVEERERARRSLSRSQATLRRLSRDLLTDQESERRRLSFELHDDLTQRIAALAIQIQLAETRLEEKNDRTHEHLHEFVESTQRLAGDVQRLSRRLHPVGLRTLGLAEATRQEIDSFTRRGGTDVDLDVDSAANEVPEGVAVAVLRILRESPHNVEKHAETE